MIKAIILDFAGALIATKGQEYTDLVQTFIENSEMKNEEDAIKFYKSELTALEAKSHDEDFMTMDEMEDKIITSAIGKYNLKKDRRAMHTLLQNFWMYAPIHDDVKEFFNLCELPIFILTNHSEDYIHVCTRRNGLHPHGILSAESVRISKPSPQFFLKAGEMTSFNNDEIMYVSNDLDTNVTYASNAGLKAILLDRKREYRNAKFERVRSLTEILANLNQ